MDMNLIMEVANNTTTKHMGNQTAIDWLKNILEEMGSADCLDVSWDFFDDAISQAKQKEKEQMHKCASFWRGKEGEIEMPIFNQYYNDTYGTANK